MYIWIKLTAVPRQYISGICTYCHVSKLIPPPCSSYWSLPYRWLSAFSVSPFFWWRQVLSLCLSSRWVLDLSLCLSPQSVFALYLCLYCWWVLALSHCLSSLWVPALSLCLSPPGGGRFSQCASTLGGCSVVALMQVCTYRLCHLFEYGDRYWRPR